MAAPITGKKVFFFTASAFGVIITVNMIMAYQAVSTFPGLVVKNGYVASQKFNDDRARQEALGWAVNLAYADGKLVLSIKDPQGNVPDIAVPDGILGRATTSESDIVPGFILSDGAFRADVALAPGKWVYRMKVSAADGTEFRQSIILYVTPDT